MVAVAKLTLVEAEAAAEEAKPSPDEDRLTELIAQKQERLEALETERKEYERVRAHLGDLMAHNRDALFRTMEELDELEGMRRTLARIRTALDPA